MPVRSPSEDKPLLFIYISFSATSPHIEGHNVQIYFIFYINRFSYTIFTASYSLIFLSSTLHHPNRSMKSLINYFERPFQNYFILNYLNIGPLYVIFHVSLSQRWRAFSVKSPTLTHQHFSHVVGETPYWNLAKTLL